MAVCVVSVAVYVDVITVNYMKLLITSRPSSIDGLTFVLYDLVSIVIMGIHFM